MKYNELRLDNWVRWDGPLYKEHARIICVAKEEVMFACGDTATYNELKPIRLTRKLLKQIGCDYFGKDNDGIDRYELNGFEILVSGNECYNLQSGRHFKSLHQLQNLYYQLKGEDIKITLK
jgi:hypothetical protein